MENKPPVTNREMTRFSIGVLAFCAVMNFFSRGFSENFAIFLLPVTEDLGWNRSAFGSIYFVYMVAHGFSAPAIGMLFDRYGPKLSYLSGLVLFGTGLLIASQMNSIWEAMLGLGVMLGVAVSATGMPAASGLVSRWFTRRITFANAIAFAGMPAGLIVLSPAIHLLIEATDWRSAYGVLGRVIWCLVPIVLFLPWKRIAGGAGNNAFSGHERPRFIETAVWRDVPFWGLFGTYFIASATSWSIMLQTVAYLVSVGFDPLLAATAYGAVGSMSVVGIIASGWACDRFGQRNVVTLGYAGTVLGILFLWLLGVSPGIVGLVAFVVMFGTSMGTRAPAVSALVAKLYPKNVAAVYGGVTIGLGLGGAVGGWASGSLYDLTGGYETGFALAMITSAIGSSLFWLIGPLSAGRWPTSETKRI